MVGSSILPGRRGLRVRLAPLLLVVAATCLHLRAETRAEIRIGLAGPETVPVSVSFGDGAVTLEIPAGAAFPADFEAASKDLLRGARLTRLADGRSRLQLTLGGGLVERIVVDSDAVTLILRSRSSGGPGERIATAGAYRIGADDKLQIAVSGLPEMTQQAVVDKTGTVSAPLIGEVPAAGLTVAELTRRITELLSLDYLVDPKVDVQVVEFRSQSAIVTGEVRDPGRVALRGGTDLKEALAEVGGFGGDAGEEIEIARRDDTGAVTPIVVDRSAFERGESNPVLQHGDLINVTRAAYVFVNGEVRSPGKIRVERGLTLLRVIALSGGFTEWAQAKSVRLLRSGEANDAETHNLRDIEAGKAEDPELRAGDVIVVRRRFL